MPANEVLFFPTLPLRVDAVKAKRGSAVSGSVMSVTSSRLVVDSSLSVSDARLVRPGDPVMIEDQDLGIKARGRVSQVAETPGDQPRRPQPVLLRRERRARACGRSSAPRSS